MRLKSEIWVKAYIRRCQASGAPAVVVKHGDDDAGAIYVRVSRLDGHAALFGPAPAGFSGADFFRRWVPLLGGGFVTDEVVQSYLDREARFDSDLWIIEIEDRLGRDFLGDDLLGAGGPGSSISAD